MNNIVKIIFAIFLTACGACGPADLEVDEGETASLEQEPSFEVWDECSQEIGEHPCDFTLKDQRDKDWTLYDNYGKVILIDFSSMWCGVCVNMASTVQSIQDQYAADGFVWVTVLIDDEQGNQVDHSDLQRWVSSHGITTSPTLAGSRDMIDPTAQDGYPISSWPTLVIINREMVLVQGMYGWNETTARTWIEQEL